MKPNRINVFFSWIFIMSNFASNFARVRNMYIDTSALFPEKTDDISNFTTTVSSSDASVVIDNEEWSTTQQWTTKKTDKVEPKFCFGYFEYCKNKNATYKFQTVLNGKMSSTEKPYRMGFLKYLSTRCYCDDQCHIYGDCCYDMLQINDTTGEPVQLAKGNDIRWECQQIPVKIKNRPKDTIEIYLVASCPLDYEDDNVIRLCERSNISSETYHYSMDVPFVSLDTNRSYVNIYCAICSNDTRIYHWEVQLHCPSAVPNCTQDLSSWEYVRGERRWLINHNNTLSSITYELMINTYGLTYNEMFNARRCRREVVRKCPPDWSDEIDRELCSAYSLLVRSIANNQIYKNEHCAVCNGQQRSPNNLVCPLKTKTIPPKGTREPIKTNSYAVLMDFYGDGNQVGGTLRKCGNSNIRCKFGEICDSLRSKCRPYTCGRMYRINSAGECILDTTTDSENNSSTSIFSTTNGMPFLNQNCPKLYVHRPLYTDLPNNSIYINATSRIYSATEHEFVNDTTVLICTNFSGSYYGKFSKIQSILSTIGISISLICLTIHIFIHLFLPQLRNLHGKNILSLSCSLLVSQSFFEFGLNLNEIYPLCVLIGMTVHFGFLASFFWMNIMAIDVCRTFASKSYRPSSDEVWKEYLKYSLYAWLMPFAIIILAITNDQFAYIPQLQPHYAQPLCWINNRPALLVFFAGPLAIMLLENVVFFLLTIRGIYKMAKVTKFARQYSTASGQGIANDRTRIILYAKLALIMGLTWIFSFIAALGDMEVLWYLFIIFNSLQGAFIFIAFSCKRKTFQLLRGRFRQTFRHKRNAVDKLDSNRTQTTKLLSFLSNSLQNLTRIKETEN